MSKQRKPIPEEPVQVNISPMIDLVFILLIFFIVTTVFVEEVGLAATKPEPGEPLPTELPVVEFVVTENGRVQFDGSEVSLGQVRQISARAIAENQTTEEVSFLVRVDEMAPAGLMVQVIDHAKLGGAGQVSIDKAY